MFRWGNTLLLLFFVSALIMAHLWSFNEITLAPITITTLNPPINLQPHHSGQVDLLGVKQGDTVNEGKVLAIIISQTDYNDILELKSFLAGMDDSLPFQRYLQNKFPLRPQLDMDLQAKYRDLLLACRNYNNHFSLNEYRMMEEEIAGNIKSHQTFRSKSIKGASMLGDEIVLEKEKLKRYENLQARGLISKNDLDDQQSKYLDKLIQQNADDREVEQTDVRIKKYMVQQSIIKEKNITVQQVLLNDLNEAKYKLTLAIKAWEDSYTVKSPIRGKVNLFDIWADLQYVKENQIVFSIIPLGNQPLMAKCILPGKNAGKLRENLSAHIRIDAYPYKEWGFIKGKIASLSEIPDSQGNYSAFLKIDDLLTSQNKKLVFKQEMTGEAEIILDRVNLLKRLFRPLNLIFNGN